MEVQNVTGTAPVSRTDRAGKSALDHDAFLQLMIAQMRNQDPTNPADPMAQLAQLASFSQVEQAIRTNEKLDALLASSALARADGIIGRTITSADGAVSGEVVALTLGAEGGVATLADGRQVGIGAGVEIR